jgi:hypothetical protein
MFAQMKSRRSSRPCPCKGTCECHAPRDESIFPLLIPIVFPLFIPILFPILFFWMLSITPKPTVHHVEFSGRDCILRSMVDNCSSTGACRTHDVVVCPEK